MRKRVLALGGSALMVAGLAAVWAAPGGAGIPGGEVSIFGDGSGSQGYDPFKMVVAKKESVLWTNDGSVDHTVTRNSGGFDSGVLNPGEDFEKTFKKVKTYKYHCSIHPEMRGKVVVQPPS